MTDQFANLKGHALRLIGPATKGVAVTPSDVTVLDVTRSLYVGSGGDIAVRFAESQTTVLFKNTTPGQLLDVRVDQVLGQGAGTTATDVIALY